MDEELISWFKDTFAARTPPRRVDEALPSSRIGWYEVKGKMDRLGYTLSITDARIHWLELFNKHLRAWVNELLKEHGEKPLPRESATSRATRRKYTAAKDSTRCQADIPFVDGSGARCMRAATFPDGLCKQHHKMALARAVLGEGKGEE